MPIVDEVGDCGVRVVFEVFLEIIRLDEVVTPYHIEGAPR